MVMMTSIALTQGTPNSGTIENLLVACRRRPSRVMLGKVLPYPASSAAGRPGVILLAATCAVLDVPFVGDLVDPAPCSAS
jgi:hypothetical protein